jgi:hypothetical protein
VQLYTGVGFGGTLLASVTQVLPVNLPIPMDPGPPIDFDFSGIARAGSWLVYGGGHDIKQSQDWFKARD